MTRTYPGSCHCGAVRFEADIDLSKGTVRCNCSFCRKARAWFTTVPPESVRLLAGGEFQTRYQWKAPGQDEPHLRYQFCKRCGVRTFGYGGDKFIFVNIGALDVDPSELAGVPIRYVDGRNDRYDREPESTAVI
ncbi:MAG TPA: GFA family protein [Myxococcales bacterium]|nr:GFA family protein [Myxococcales bacterium]